MASIRNFGRQLLNRVAIALAVQAGKMFRFASPNSNVIAQLAEDAKARRVALDSLRKLNVPVSKPSRNGVAKSKRAARTRRNIRAHASKRK